MHVSGLFNSNNNNPKISTEDLQSIYISRALCPNDQSV